MISECIFSRDIPGRIFTSCGNKLEDLLGKQVDLLVLNETTPSLAWTALKGKRLFIQDVNFYIQYMLAISTEAEDFQQFLLDWWCWRMKIKGAV